MNEKAEGKVNSFIESVNSLFAEIESWIAATSLKGIRQEIEISEEASGRYSVDKLTLENNERKKIAEFIPIATFIIGGNGRVDLIGTIDKVIIVNLEIDGSAMTTTITAGGYTETRTTSFYIGIEKPGWYWIEDGKRGKANFFTKELFIELLREVSDYELN
ncbi:MAG: hypothetical protein C4527_25175 [Candidatus Omnitrophota bacterium]|jgi:hypothetical protein|nr:MAG: hypothetical protein C4527_25175 [Candidatus Omnitrophota bacterium]